MQPFQFHVVSLQKQQKKCIHISKLINLHFFSGTKYSSYILVCNGCSRLDAWSKIAYTNVENSFLILFFVSAQFYNLYAYSITFLIHVLIYIFRQTDLLWFKVHIFWEGHKILRNLHQLFDWQYIGQIIGGDFANFCGLLRLYELYQSNIFEVIGLPQSSSILDSILTHHWPSKG